MNACGLDFGTSNSAIAVSVEMESTLVDLEHGHASLPTALFFDAETEHTSFGRQAIRDYIGGAEGRLLRALKSILGSSLIDETTLVRGRSTSYRDIITIFLRHLKAVAENDTDFPLDYVVMGRPVFFVDDDAERDRAAQRTLEECARAAGFVDVRFELEPIAAALDYETSLTDEQITLVVDIGGGTSDFSIVRLGPGHSGKPSRSEDILGTLGVHLGGTDFDHLLSLNCVMPTLGYRAAGRGGLEIPKWVYFDLATWHSINLLQTRKHVEEVRRMRHFYADPSYHGRLLHVLSKRMGHLLLGRVEDAKIAASDTGVEHRIALDEIEHGLGTLITPALLEEVLAPKYEAIVETAVRAVAEAGLTASGIDTIYYTGGSTALASLRARFATAFPASRSIFGDPIGSVAKGLAVKAQTVFA